jgi:U3 small nucleolar RNA-associated protein 21
MEYCSPVHVDLQVERLVDPLGNSIASIMVFGTQLLALSQDGRRLVIWSTNSSGIA